MTVQVRPRADRNRLAEAEKVKISFWVLNQGWEWIDPAVADFETANPNIDVEVTHYEVDPMKEALKVAASSRDACRICGLHGAVRSAPFIPKMTLRWI